MHKQIAPANAMRYYKTELETKRISPEQVKLANYKINASLIISFSIASEVIEILATNINFNSCSFNKE